MGVDSYETQLADIRRRQQQATAAAAQAQTALDQALAAEQHWQQQLKSDFGCENVDEARSKMAELQQRLDSTIEAATRELERTKA